MLIREENYEELIKKLGNDILRINEAITMTKRSRKEAHSKIENLINEKKNLLLKSIEVYSFLIKKAERHTREKNEEMLIRLLDEAVTNSSTQRKYF